MTVPYTPTTPDLTNDVTVFPLLPGENFKATKSPQWSTKTITASAGGERRRQLWSYPKWRFQISHEVLRLTASKPELQRLFGFFNAHAGMYSSFSYYDPGDNLVTDTQFGTGDGAATVFQLSRIGGTGAMTWVEPVQSLVANPFITVNGVMLGAPLSTNLLTYSQAFDNAAWTKFDATVTPNSTAAPDGSNTADTLVRTTTGNHYIYQVASGSFVGETVTFSVWIKAGTLAGNIALLVRDGTNTTNYGSATITPTGTWVRYTVTGSFPGGAATGLLVAIDPANDTGSAGDTLFLWGAQAEIGAAATGYIPTTSAGGDFTVTGGVVTFNAAPSAAAPLVWSGQFMFRVRFEQDNLDATELMQTLWSQGGLAMITEKR